MPDAPNPVQTELARLRRLHAAYAVAVVRDDSLTAVLVRLSDHIRMLSSGQRAMD